jgi:hypothetical protein
MKEKRGILMHVHDEGAGISKYTWEMRNERVGGKFHLVLRIPYWLAILRKRNDLGYSSPFHFTNTFKIPVCLT